VRCCNGMGSEGIMEQVFDGGKQFVKHINHLQNYQAVFVQVREY
jgi:hypothetical protein